MKSVVLPRPPAPQRSVAGAAIAPGARSAVVTRRRVQRGDTLFDAGDAFSMLFVVCAGTLKTFTLSDDGHLQVTGFPMRGDVVGMDGIGGARHASTVVALEDAELLSVPFAQCEASARTSAHAQLLLTRMLAQEIARGQNLLFMLGTMRAEQRVALFLLDFSRRYGQLGYSRAQFTLRMTRRDIGAHLGLKLETVSRCLSQLQRDGAIQVQGKTFALLDFPSLEHLCGALPAADARCADPAFEWSREILAGWNATPH
jgi:CRP/FNR family transcriptional regulator